MNAHWTGIILSAADWPHISSYLMNNTEDLHKDLAHRLPGAARRARAAGIKAAAAAATADAAADAAASEDAACDDGRAQSAGAAEGGGEHALSAADIRRQIRVYEFTRSRHYKAARTYWTGAASRCGCADTADGRCLTALRLCVQTSCCVQ